MPDLSSLQRQRRFLILMSLAVIAYYFLGATPNERAEYSGFGVTLANPQGVVAGLWVVWGWALWRYAQCVYERLSVVWSEVIEDVAAEDRRMASKRALRYARQQAAGKEFDTVNRKDMTVVDVKLGPAGGSKDGEVYILDRDGMRVYTNVVATVGFVTAANEPRHGKHEFQFPMHAPAVRAIRTRAWLYAIVGLPAFSEHVAPLVLAIAVPLFALSFGDASQQLHADNIDRFWRVYSETDLISFDIQPQVIDVSIELQALSAALRTDQI
jgi:hypothetical protein